MTPREPDRYDAGHDLWKRLQGQGTSNQIGILIAALCHGRDAALDEAAQAILAEETRRVDHVLPAMSPHQCADLLRALASPAAAPAWMPPRDAMTGMTAAEEMRAAGIDVLRGARPAAAPAAEPSAPAAPAPLQMDEDWCCVICGRGLEPCYACGPVPAQGAEARIQELEELVAEANRQLAALAARTSSPPGAGERK